jgi:hypothetical protein
MWLFTKWRCGIPDGNARLWFQQRRLPSLSRTTNLGSPTHSTFPMRLEAHRHIKWVSAEIDLQPDGTVKPISVVYTDLELNSLRPGYDAAAVEELVGRLQMFQKTHHQPLRILTVRDASRRQDSEANQ